MLNLPQRHSLASQMVDILREDIRQGTWQDRLPGERALCEKYQISRNTLRTALGQLKRAKLIRAVHGSGNWILAKPRGKNSLLQSRDVGLLSPEPLERLRPKYTLWIDELRSLLSERGCRLHVFHGRQYFRANPGQALQRLIAKDPHGCWILILSNTAIQHWFAKNEVHCVVAGSVYAGLELAYRDLDHRALCRHAAGVLLRLGHRKLAFMVAKSQLAGDLESEAGFVEGVTKFPQAGSEAFVCRHDGSVDGIGRALRRLMEQSHPPTAILVANAYHYLAVVSRLVQMGRRVPQDVSVISRDDDLFLSYLTPIPARYASSSHIMAKSLLRPVLELLENTTPTSRELHLLPEFIQGDSISRPP
jgi:LacI family transcriptional regulator